MSVLYGAVAYREDLVDKYETEMNSWDLVRKYEHPIACPQNPPCDKTYVLVVETNAADETAKEYIEGIHRQMEAECPRHSETIKING